MVPIKNWHPTIPEGIYFLMAIFIVVGCANAVNLLDGLDSLVSVSIINTLLFIGSVSSEIKTIFNFSLHSISPAI